MDKEGKTIAFITLLRGLAVLLIAWDHMVGAWLDWNKASWLPLTFVRQNFTRPFGIIQDFGFIGVSLLFLMSGFLITLICQTETRKEFSIKRLFRIYPPLIVSIILIIAFNWIYAIGAHSHTLIQDLNLQSILLGCSLANYFFVPQNVLNGIAWILAVEVLFYFVCFLLLPFLKLRPKISIAFLLLFIVFTLFLAGQFGTSYFLFAVIVSYFPYLVMGQVLCYFWKRRFGILEYSFFSIVTMLVCILGLIRVNPEFIPINNSYILSFFYAYIIFVVSLLFTNRIKIGRLFGFFSKISYSFYLNQTSSYLWFLVLFPAIGFEFSLGIVFVLLIFLAYLSWRFVEEPSRKFARKIITFPFPKSSKIQNFLFEKKEK